MKANKIFEGGRFALVIGDGLFSRILAVKLALISDIPCVICDARRSAACLIFPTCAFFGMPAQAGKDMLELCLANVYERAGDGMKFIIVNDKKYSAFEDNLAKALEDRYIFANKRTIFSYSSGAKPQHI